jgi:hypothetical protein
MFFKLGNPLQNGCNITKFVFPCSGFCFQIFYLVCDESFNFYVFLHTLELCFVCHIDGRYYGNTTNYNFVVLIIKKLKC